MQFYERKLVTLGLHPIVNRSLFEWVLTCYDNDILSVTMDELVRNDKSFYQVYLGHQHAN